MVYSLDNCSIEYFLSKYFYLIDRIRKALLLTDDIQVSVGLTVKSCKSGRCVSSDITSSVLWTKLRVQHRNYNYLVKLVLQNRE